jgi:bifunctional DNA-binding transcriptional regulator/antitoxin component of YhaV-PrlF toxin-antitoxin module
MIRELVRLRNRNQMTLPAEMAERLSLKPGALLELVLDPENNRIELRRAEVVRAGTPEAKREEQAALEAIKAGRFKTFASIEEFSRDMKETRAKVALEERVESLQQQLDGVMTYFRQCNLDPLNLGQYMAVVEPPISTGKASKGAAVGTSPLETSEIG